MYYFLIFHRTLFITNIFREKSFKALHFFVVPLQRPTLEIPNWVHVYCSKTYLQPRRASVLKWGTQTKSSCSHAIECGGTPHLCPNLYPSPLPPINKYATCQKNILFVEMKHVRGELFKTKARTEESKSENGGLHLCWGHKRGCERKRMTLVMKHCRTWILSSAHW